MACKEKDFIEISYTGRLKDSGEVFDTTEEDIAKKEDLYSKDSEYGPQVVCLGQHHILPGLDHELVGKEKGSYKIELTAEKAFGKKQANLIQMVPANKFREAKIQAMPGLQVTIDNQRGIIKMIGGGRVLVGLNHPLPGKDVVYEVTIIDQVADKKRQVLSLLKHTFNLKPNDIEIAGKSAIILFEKEFPAELAVHVIKPIKELCDLDSVEFRKKEQSTKA